MAPTHIFVNRGGTAPSGPNVVDCNMRALKSPSGTVTNPTFRNYIRSRTMNYHRIRTRAYDPFHVENVEFVIDTNGDTYELTYIIDADGNAEYCRDIEPEEVIGDGGYSDGFNLMISDQDIADAQKGIAHVELETEEDDE